MYKNEIKYPVAYNFATKDIVMISDVTNENKPFLGCPSCRKGFVAVRNHQTPHFKHKHGARCSVSPETYLHWVTKMVFKQIEEIEIPELLIDDLPERHRQKFQQTFNKIIDPNVPESFRSIFKKGLKDNLSESRKLVLDKVDLEKEFETILGNIRVDIVATASNEKLFIEPFFTNPIDEEKRKKLILIKTPTLSIDLKKFIDHFGQVYSIPMLKGYLISKKSKKWSYLNEEDYNKHIENYESYLFGEIERKRPLINSHQSKLNKLSALEDKRQNLNKEIDLIRKEIDNLDSDIYDLKEDLGINY